MSISMPIKLKLDFNERSDYISPIAKGSEFETLWKYPEREMLESKIAEINSLNSEQVLCTNGGDEAIMLLMRIIKESAKLILPLPAFSQYTWGVESWRLDAKLIPANEDLTINLRSTLNAVEKTQNSVVIITRPNNPTGEKIQKDELLDLIEVAQRRNSWVFLDEAYIEFSDSSIEATSLLSQFNNLVILRTLSKAYGLAGIRVGYVMGAPELIEQFRIRCMPFNLPQPCIQIASTALSETNTDEVKQYCNVIKHNRAELTGWLKSNGVEFVASEANFVLIRLAETQAKAAESFLAKSGISIRSFGRDDLSGCLRITIPYDLTELLTLLEKVLVPGLVCFDMDGVLIDTSQSYDAAVRATIETMSGQSIDEKKIFERRDSGGFNNDWVLSQALLKQMGFEFSLEQVTEKFQQFYLGKDNTGLVANEKLLIDKSLIKIVNASNQTRFAIVTGRPKAEANAGIELVGFNNVDLISLDDVDVPKPSPEGIKKLQCRYSKKSWMCGDNPDDMQAANASNSLAIGIGSRNANALYQAGADIVLENINQLESWLKPVN